MHARVWPIELTRRPDTFNNAAVGLVSFEGKGEGCSCLCGRCNGFADDLGNRAWTKNVPGALTAKGIDQATWNRWMQVRGC